MRTFENMFGGEYVAKRYLTDDPNVIYTNYLISSIQFDDYFENMYGTYNKVPRNYEIRPSDVPFQAYSGGFNTWSAPHFKNVKHLRNFEGIDNDMMITYFENMGISFPSISLPKIKVPKVVTKIPGGVKKVANVVADIPGGAKKVAEGIYDAGEGMYNWAKGVKEGAEDLFETGGKALKWGIILGVVGIFGYVGLKAYQSHKEVS